MSVGIAGVIGEVNILIGWMDIGKLCEDFV